MRRYNCFCLSCGKRYQEDSEKEPQNTPCPECGSGETKVLGEQCGVFGKFSSMSPQEKQKVLKKRSTEHFKKEIKDKKEYLDRAAIGLTK